MANSIADMYMEQGELRGEVKGGVKTARRLLIRVLEARFGTIPKELTQLIDGMDDLARLEGAVTQAARVSKLDEFNL